MSHWYRVVVESGDPVEAEQRAASFERAIRSAAEESSRSSSSVRVYYDWLPAGRGRVFWISAAAFAIVSDLAGEHGAEAYQGLADMRHLVPLFD